MRAGVDAVARQVVDLVAQAAAQPRGRAVAADGAAQRALGVAAAVPVLRVALTAAPHLHEVPGLRQPRRTQGWVGGREETQTTLSRRCAIWARPGTSKEFTSDAL